jgi:hypothetical protein
MQENIIESIFQKSKLPRWLPVLSMFLSLFGVVFLNEDYQHIIILFVSEIILMLSFSLIRMLFAMNELPFHKTIVEKLFYLGLGIFIGGFFVVFAFLFISAAIQTATFFAEIRKIQYQIYVLTIGYIVGLFSNYFANQNFKSASPMSQMLPYIHVLVVLVFLQAFTGHLLPSFPNLNQAVWGIVALVLVKFVVDLLFSFFQNPYMFSNNKEILFHQKEYITTHKTDDSSHKKNVSEL